MSSDYELTPGKVFFQQRVANQHKYGFWVFYCILVCTHTSRPFKIRMPDTWTIALNTNMRGTNVCPWQMKRSASGMS